MQRLFDRIYANRLKHDLDRWIAEGWVSSEGGARILGDLERHDGRSRLPMALGGIGVVCVALAVAAFIAANWDGIDRTVKLAGIAVMVLSAHALAAYAAGRGRRGIADLATAFATLVFVGGMALVGQIFHLPQDWAGGALLVCLGGLAAAWVTRSKASLVVAAVAGMVWQVTRSEYGPAPAGESLLGLALLVVVMLHPVAYPARLSRWVAIALLLTTYGRWLAEAGLRMEPDDPTAAMILAGSAALFAVMTLLGPVIDMFVKWSSERPLKSAGHWLLLGSLQDVGFMLLTGMAALAMVLSSEVAENTDLAGLLALPAMLPLAAAALLIAVGLVLSFKTAKAQAIFAAVGGALLATLAPLVTDNVLLLAGLGLAALIGLCALATWFNNAFWTLCAYVGLTAVVLWLLEVTVGSLLGQSVFFLVAGVALLGMAWWVARLLRRGETSSGDQAQGEESHP